MAGEEGGELKRWQIGEGGTSVIVVVKGVCWGADHETKMSNAPLPNIPKTGKI